MAGIFVGFFSKLTWPLLDTKERYTRTKGGGGGGGGEDNKKKKSMELLYFAAFKTDSVHSVKKQYFSTPALL